MLKKRIFIIIFYGLNIKLISALQLLTLLLKEYKIEIMGVIEYIIFYVGETQ